MHTAVKYSLPKSSLGFLLHDYTVTCKTTIGQPGFKNTVYCILSMIIFNNNDDI